MRGVIIRALAAQALAGLRQAGFWSSWGQTQVVRQPALEIDSPHSIGFMTNHQFAPDEKEILDVILDKASRKFEDVSFAHGRHDLLVRLSDHIRGRRLGKVKDR